MEKLKQEKEKLLEELDVLEQEKKDIFEYIKSVDGKIDKLTKKIVNLEADIKNRKLEIKSLKKEIKKTENIIAVQYETMKKRIKYMYEHGNAEYIDIILSSKSLTDMLSRSEYIQKISEYDENMLTEYLNTKNFLEMTMVELVAAKEALERDMEYLKEKRNTLELVVEKKQKKLDEYNKNISLTENAIDDNADELAKQEKIIEDALLQQQREIMEKERLKKEEEERKRQEELKRKEEEQAQNNDSTAVVTPTPVPQSSNPVDSSGFVWPLSGRGTITSYFGKRTSPTAGASSYHQGIDVGIAAGTPILAAKSGTVVTAAYSTGAGNYVMINHGDGVFTVYMHASSLNAKVGQNVSAGDVIAYVGSTGVSTGNHLHFGVSVNGVYVNPLDYVS
ncbi:MAG: peptidase M23 [Lachnospiraceae bacterium]|nr:peptidase M23 [Lachnospiraceae bacterium]